MAATAHEHEPAGRRRHVVVVVCGTRPEAIKLAPLVLALRAHERVEPVVVLSGQHPELAAQAFSAFGVEVARDLAVRAEGGAETLAELSAALTLAIDGALDDLRPDAVVVQGDTTTAYAAAVTAFYRHVPVVHLEAGLRTDDLRSPFPEEFNRRAISIVADLHLAPTQAPADRLVAEGVDPSRVVVTGNTVVDAVRLAADLPCDLDPAIAGVLDGREPRRLLLLTAHRRESWGPPLTGIAEAVRTIADRHPDVVVVVPVHPNPAVRDRLEPVLDGHPRVVLCEPLDYVPMAHLVRRATVLLTDSGGLQEEAPTFGTPVLVLRNTTERPEGIAAGCALLVGTDPDAIVRECERLLTDPAHHAAMASATNPYGDGHAAARSVEALVALLDGGSARPGTSAPDA